MKAEMESKEIFESMPIARALRMMAVPTIMSQIVVLIYNMADTFYIGKTNDPNMVAATSLILPVFNICLSLVGLMGVGGGSLISRLLGKNEQEEAKKVSSFSIYFSILITAVFSMMIGIFMSPVLHLLGADGHTFGYAKQYTMCIIVIGGIPTVLSNVMANLLRSIGISKKAGFGIMLGGALNILLDPIFMFGLLPKGQEVLGVGIATCLSNCISCLYFISVILREKSIITFRLKVGLPTKQNIGSIFNVGIPSALATLLFDLDYIIIDKLMVGYGNVALAAVGIVLKVERLPLNVGVGLCQGMMPLVAYNYASGNYPRMKQVVRCSRSIGWITSAISIVLYEIFAKYLMQIFIADAGTVSLGTDFLRVRILATPLMFMSFFTVYLFQAFGRGERSLFLGVMRWLAFNIPMLFILNHIIGMYGIVWSQVTADILTVILSVCVYRSFERKNLSMIPNIKEE